MYNTKAFNVIFNTLLKISNTKNKFCCHLTFHCCMWILLVKEWSMDSQV